MIALWRRNRWDFAMLFLPSLGYLLLVSNSWEWHGGWNAPGRYALCVAALMTPAASLVLSRKLRWLIAVLAAWGLTVSIFFTVNPYLRMNSYWEMNKFSMWVEMLHDHIATPFYSVLSIFPNFKVAAPVDYVRGWIWVILLAGSARWWANCVQSKSVSQK
jgi:hypothetical protein